MLSQHGPSLFETCLNLAARLVDRLLQNSLGAVFPSIVGTWGWLGEPFSAGPLSPHCQGEAHFGLVQKGRLPAAPPPTMGSPGA